jgi:hypothetical protein
MRCKYCKKEIEKRVKKFGSFTWTGYVVPGEPLNYVYYGARGRYGKICVHQSMSETEEVEALLNEYEPPHLTPHRVLQKSNPFLNESKPWRSKFRR